MGDVGVVGVGAGAGVVFPLIRPCCVLRLCDSWWGVPSNDGHMFVDSWAMRGADWASSPSALTRLGLCAAPPICSLRAVEFGDQPAERQSGSTRPLQHSQQSATASAATNLCLCQGPPNKYLETFPSPPTGTTLNACRTSHLISTFPNCHEGTCIADNTLSELDRGGPGRGEVSCQS